MLPGTEVLYENATGSGGGAVMDATRDGQRVAVLISNEVSGMNALPSLMISDDLGGTWVQHDLPTPASMNVNPLNVNDLSLNPMMVHLYQGQVFLLIATVQSGGNSLYLKFAVAKVDLVANTYALVGDVLGGHAFAIGATIGTYELEINSQNSTYYDARFNQYDVSTDMNAATNLPVPPSAGRCNRPYFTADGVTYEAYCDVCRAHATPAANTLPVSNCAAAGSLAADDQTLLYGTGRGVMAFYNSQNHAWAASLSEDSPAVWSTPIDLGAGRIPESSNDNQIDGAWGLRGNHQRFGGLVSIPADMTGSALRFVEIPATGDAVERPLPQTPCADASSCGVPAGNRSLTWSLRLEGDQFLDFYRLNASESKPHITLYVRRDTVPGQPIVR